MQERHKNKSRYFQEQAQTTEKHVIPYLSDVLPITPETSVLEIGCGEGGNLLPFLERNCKPLVGVDLHEGKIALANTFFADQPNKDNVHFLVEDIYDSKNLGQYDLIMMRDVIEHIHDQEKFMGFCKQFLKPGGKVFFGFPPWYNPFGGHQQTCKNKWLSKTPWFHLLPRSLYKGILSLGGETETNIKHLLEIKDTGISVERFERIAKNAGYAIDKKTLWLFNPNYETKFGLTPRVQLPVLRSIPFLRNFISTCGYYVISLK